MTIRVHAATALLLALCALTHPAWPAGKYPEPKDPTVLFYFAPKAAQAPRLDGVLDDACWKSAPLITDFGRIHRGEGDIRKQTFAQMVYDDKAIYVAFRCLEPEMENLKILTGRDARVWAGDSVEIYLQPEPERLTRYQLAANLAGSKWDAWITGKARYDKPDVFWGRDAVWSAAGRKGENEWTLEVRLPYSDFGIRPGNIFRFNLVRLTWTAGKEFSAWANATFEQKDFRYWAYFVFDGPGVDKRATIREIVPDHADRIVSWPTQAGVARLDHGKLEETAYTRLGMDELDALDGMIRRVEEGMKEIERARKLTVLPASLEDLKRRREALARRIRKERFSALGLKHFRERVARTVEIGRDIEWEFRGLEILSTGADPRRNPEVFTGSYVASPARERQIREGIVRVTLGMSASEMKSIMGEPDQVLDLIIGGPEKQRVVGETWWYFVQREAGPPRKVKVVRISIRQDKKVIKVDFWGMSKREGRRDMSR